MPSTSSSEISQSAIFFFHSYFNIYLHMVLLAREVDGQTLWFHTMNLRRHNRYQGADLSDSAKGTI